MFSFISSDKFTLNVNQYTLDVSKMSAKEKAIYQAVLDNAIQEYKSNDPNFNESEFTKQVNFVLASMDSSGNSRPTTRALIELSIPNGAVATAVNVVISLAVGGATSAALRAFILKVGAKQAANILAKQVVSRLLALGIREVSGVGTIIRTVVKNILDPGSTIAEYLDNHDPVPGNGHVDVRAF